MTTNIKVTNPDNSYKYKVTVIGKTDEDKYYLVSTCANQKSAKAWIKDKISTYRFTSYKSKIQLNDGELVIQSMDDSVFANLDFTHEDETKNQPKLATKRAFYENVWDAFRRMW